MSAHNKTSALCGSFLLWKVVMGSKGGGTTGAEPGREEFSAENY